MQILSFPIILLLLLILLLYYTFFRLHQWLLLLVSSAVLWELSIQKIPYTFLFITVVSYCGTIFCIKQTKYRSIIKWVTIFLCLAGLILGRQWNFFAVLGASYVTLKAISYVIDIEREPDRIEKNPLFYVLYLIYFPTILQGPFNRYPQFKKNFTNCIKFDYIRVLHGIQRFLWGACKKLVLTERLRDYPTAVIGNMGGYYGLEIIIAIAMYTLWFYTDFSSYMDMMIGVSECFGIEIPENFRQPFFSRSIAEFWRRWHITLGSWFRDYVMMTFIQSEMGRRLRKFGKRFGKQAGKMLPVIIGSFFVWLFTGLWHGNGIRYIIWGMYYYVIIVGSQLLEHGYGRGKARLHITEKSVPYNIFCVFRTWILIFIGNIITAIGRVSDLAVMFSRISHSFVPENMTDVVSGIGNKMDLIIISVGFVMLFIVSVLKERDKKPLEIVDCWILPVRWIAYYFLIFSILFWGRYGAGYDASNFLYTQF